MTGSQMEAGSGGEADHTPLSLLQAFLLYLARTGVSGESFNCKLELTYCLQ